MGGDSAHPSQEQSQQLQARFGFGRWCKTGREGSAAVETVSGLTPRGRGAGGRWPSGLRAQVHRSPFAAWLGGPPPAVE
jgi:hypothetical protein